jgi:hypothetical protein
MMPTARPSEETVFETALEMKDAAERRAFLDRVCSADSKFRAKIEKLIAGHEAAEIFFADCKPLPTGAADKMPNEPGQTPGEIPGALIGSYKLLQIIGEGGCGVVYMAEQRKPVRRRVALKIIKLGMDTKSVIARFEAERQALALMEHPNIARVLDAGATETGRPYFVMELVNGVKITEYCDQRQLDTRQRLDLFIQVCHAIQHAHQKGIIHRDIKPSNILVTLHDGVPVPKVIDFGIAKATEERLTDKTFFTAHGHFIGTPAYMSPEQAEMSGLDVDTRSDIYSLGVLLYELLTGKTPFDQKELLASGLDEMRRTLREREPHRPSAKINTLHGTELTSTAQHRHVEPPKLISQLRGDLDWIVMKALEKDRKRRYETANGLAMDIQRYLNNEPVLARPPSRLYRFQKLVRRNQGIFAAAGAVAAALVLGLGLSTWLFLAEKEARKRAVNAEQIQSELRQQAETREKINQAAFLVSQNRFAEADKLAAETRITKPTLEGAAVFRSLGEWYALHQEWKLAAARFAVLSQINQLDGADISSLDVLAYGVALVESGDINAYNHYRQTTVARFASNTNSVVGARVLKACLLLPLELKNVEPLDSLAEIAEAKVAPGAEIHSSVTVPWQQTSSGGIRPWSQNEASFFEAAPTFADAAGLVGAGAKNAHQSVLVGVCSFDGWSIGVNFSEPMDPASATNKDNYNVSGTAVTAVTRGDDSKSVVLSLSSQLAGGFTVSVHNLKDAAQNSVTIENAMAGTVLGLQLKDFGTGQPFSATYRGNDATIVAGGSDIWERADSFVYAYTKVTGDFDYRLKIHSIAPAWDKFTRVGLMARDSLTDSGCCHVMVAVNAENSFQVLLRTTTNGETASLPPNPLPTAYGSNSWVRLQRAGTVFHAYSSDNGIDWAPLFQMSESDNGTGGNDTFTDPIYLGIAICSHSISNTVTAVVSDLGTPPTVSANAAVALALLEYRRGNYAKSEEWCRQCLEYPEYNASRTAVAQVILALVNQQQHQFDKARSELAVANDLINRKFADELNPGSSSQGFWFDWVFARILLREATAMIENTAPSPANH